MPASAYSTTEARIRQAIFKFIQMHLKLHLRTIRQTITPKNGSPSNRYYSLNHKALALALQTLAEQYVDGLDVTITEVEAVVVPGDDAKKNLWKFILQTLISILTAILTALGATSCMGLH